MFIITSEPPPVLTEVEVQMQLPEGHSIRLRGRVVHVIDAQQAAAAQHDPGVGIEFIGLEPEMRAQIHQLIDFARWQGTSHRPTATLASHMFGMNATRSTGEVLGSLPSPPADHNAGTSRSGVRRASNMPSRPSDDPGRSAKASSDPPKKKRRVSAAPDDATGGTASLPAAAPPPPKPTDQVELKVGMTHLARKRFVEATKHFNEMLSANPGDIEVTKWLHITEARRALAAGKEVAARTSYERALSVDENNMEARKFVREVDQRKKLEALPFGRYFVKKKP
jgi:hypothetical protein